MHFDDHTHEMYPNSLRMAPWGLKHIGLLQYEYSAVNILSVLVRLLCKIVRTTLSHLSGCPPTLLQKDTVFKTCHFWNNRWGTIPENKQSYFYIFISRQDFFFWSSWHQKHIDIWAALLLSLLSLISKPTVKFLRTNGKSGAILKLRAGNSLWAPKALQS